MRRIIIFWCKKIKILENLEIHKNSKPEIISETIGRIRLLQLMINRRCSTENYFFFSRLNWFFLYDIIASHAYTFPSTDRYRNSQDLMSNPYYSNVESRCNWVSCVNNKVRSLILLPCWSIEEVHNNEYHNLTDFPTLVFFNNDV